MIKRFLFAAGLFLLSVSVFSQTTANQGIQSITAEELKGYFYFLASDKMGGRAATSPEYEIALQYLATQFSAMELKPAIQSQTKYLADSGQIPNFVRNE